MPAYLPPALVLSIVIAACYGTLFHLLWGRKATDLLRALGVSIIGFLAGELGARLAGVHLLMLGDVHFGMASVIAWAGLAIDYWWKWET